MTRIKLLFPLLALLVAPAAFAGQYSLNEWCFYVNSLDLNHSCAEAGGSGSISAPFQNVSFNTLLGGGNTLGTVQVTVGAGTSNVFALWDYNVSGTGFNEYATAIGTLPIGESYSVDAPGDPSSGGTVSSPYTPGYLTNNFNNGTLDNTNHLPSCTSGTCEDVAVSLEQTITVPNGQTDTVTFTVGSTPPPDGGFYVSQTDGSGNTVYFSSSVTPSGSGSGPLNLGAEFATPEPGSIALLAGGLGLLAWFRRRRIA